MLVIFTDDLSDHLRLLGTHGGHTTFTARGTKANQDSIRLAPFVGVIDGTTGRPASRVPLTITNDHQEMPPVWRPLEEAQSRWRLPVLLFCGKDDEGMSVEDEAYLDRPL